MSDEESELKGNSTAQEEPEDVSEKVEPKQKKLFWMISTGSNSSDLILLNFFQYFAANIVTLGILGYLTAIRNLLKALFQEFFGRLSDRRGRKTFLIIGFFLSFVATVLLAFSYRSQIMLIVVITIHAFSFSISLPVWNATIGDVTEIKGRTTFIGKLTAIGQGVGVALMLILTGFFYILKNSYSIILDWRIEYGIVFAISALCLFLSAIGVLFLKETRKPDLIQQQPRMLTALKNKPFRNFIIVNSVYGIAMAVLWPIYPVIQVNYLGMEIYQLTLVSAIYAICFTVSSFFGGKIGDRIGRKPVLIFTRFMLFTVSLLYIPAVIYNAWGYVILTNVVSGLCNGAFFIVMNAYALDCSSEDTKGSYSGLAQVSWGIATSVGSLVAGFISQAIVNNAPVPPGEATKYMIIVTTIAIGVLRILASIGYFFVKESLPSKKAA
ncbi:MAG: MFS transporter [Asgard group archaeon]|nr:MFS transporter [Asgard group archaeon]